MINDILLYVIRHENLFFVRDGKWVEKIEDARIYEKIGHARGVVTQYNLKPPPEIIEENTLSRERSLLLLGPRKNISN